MLPFYPLTAHGSTADRKVAAAPCGCAARRCRQRSAANSECCASRRLQGARTTATKSRRRACGRESCGWLIQEPNPLPIVAEQPQVFGREHQLLGAACRIARICRNETSGRRAQQHATRQRPEQVTHRTFLREKTHSSPWRPTIQPDGRHTGRTSAADRRTASCAAIRRLPTFVCAEAD